MDNSPDMDIVLPDGESQPFSDAMSFVHPRPTSERPPAKRRRVNPVVLLDLPVETISKVIRFLHPHFPEDDECLRFSSVLELLPLRTVCTTFCDAFDGHITTLNVSSLQGLSLQFLLLKFLPRFRNLATLWLPKSAMCTEMHTYWTSFLCKRTTARIRHLIFAHEESINQEYPYQPSLSTVKDVMSGLNDSLEILSTDCNEVVTAVGMCQNNIHTANLVMDNIIESALLGFRSMRSLSLVYRKGIDVRKLNELTRVINHIQHGGMIMHLRVNQIQSLQFESLSLLPGLRKVSFFDGIIEGANRGMLRLAACKFLDEIQFEWMKGLNGSDIVVLATEMGDRLRKIRIWECSEVTDEGLEALAVYCPRAEVELRFFRDQFSHGALAKLGDRVSWGSYEF